MKNRSFIFGLIFAICGTASHAQVQEMYRQGFENGEPQSYTLTGQGSTQTTVSNGGTSAMKLSHNAQSVVLQLNDIDLTGDATMQYFVLEFSQICNVSPSACQNANTVAVVEAKFPHQTEWTSLRSFYTTHNGAETFPTTGSFSKNSYAEWSQTPLSNTMWKKETFQLDNLFSGVALSSRILQVRVTLNKKVTGGTSTEGWYLDDIVLKGSSQAMVTPSIDMLCYPDLLATPSSSGTKIEAAISTSAAAGMNSDSIYVLYKVGTNPAVNKLRMTIIPGSGNRYKCYIPFNGYDTMMYFRIVAKDATLNRNAAYYPEDGSSWIRYYNIRGTANYAEFPATTTGTENKFPFPAYATNKSEYVYDSVTMRAAGYKAGAIVAIDYTPTAAVTAAQTRGSMTIRMKNAYSSHMSTPTTYTGGNFPYSDGYMQPVYEGNYTIPVTPAGEKIRINLTDTFYYAGSDLIVQFIYGNQQQTANPAATPVETFPTASTTKNSIYTYGFSSSYRYDPYAINKDKFAAGYTSLNRPRFVFEMIGNMPMMYDMGVEELLYPNYDNASMANEPDQIRVKLHNYGSVPVNGARIAYRLDNGSVQYYDWTGVIPAGGTSNVQITNSQVFTKGYHSLTAWVEDTLIVAGSRLVDYEPLNDTASTTFIACEGPLSGNVKIGGSNPDYATIDEFMFAVSRCGIGGPLTVKLAQGTYDPLVIPELLGLSTQNYLQFEPATATSVVAFEAGTNDESPALLDLSAVSHVRFSNIRFVDNRRSGSGMTNMIRLANSSKDCRFLNCSFTESVQTRDVIFSGGADSLLVDGCQFDGGGVGVNLTGFSSDNRSSNNSVVNSHFVNIGSNCVKSQYQISLLVDNNYMDDCSTFNGALVMAQDCSGALKITRNKMHTTHGSAGISVNNIQGTASVYALIANNMIVCEYDGMSTDMTAPLSVFGGTYMKVVYNSVKMTAEASGKAAAKLGGSTLDHTYFMNNIVSTYDIYNFALEYVPGTNVTINGNIYYTAGNKLNKYNTNTCNTLMQWRSYVTPDYRSKVADPAFMTTSDPLDLRTFSQDLSEVALPVAEVTTDIYGTARNATEPCPGAFEFEPLYYDFSVVEVEEPLSDYCDASSNVPIRIRVTNTGLRDYDPATSGSASIQYSCSAPGITGRSNTGTINIDVPIPTGEVVELTPNATLNLAPQGDMDSTFRIYFWVNAAIDPNALNDTVLHRVISRVRLAAPDDMNVDVNYSQPASLSVTNGVRVWETGLRNGYSSEPSILYWYADSNATQFLQNGNPLETEPLFDDTVFYVRQRRELAMMRISEIQFSKELSRGATDPRPDFMHSGTNFAIELTNVGDGPARLLGDTLIVTSNEVAYQNKIVVMPDIVIQPGRSLVVQYYSSATTTDSTVTFKTTTLAPPPNKNLAILYHHGGRLVDAVAMNSMTVQSVWTRLHVPESIWKGNGIQLSAEAGGLTRLSFPPKSGTAGNYAALWREASVDNPLTMGETNPDLIVYSPSQCEGALGKVQVTVVNKPTVDLAIDGLEFPDGCGLYEEPVVVNVHNFGVESCSSVTLHYSINDSLIDNGYISTLPAGGSCSFTFSQLAPLHAEEDATFNVKVWVDGKSSDARRMNDTASVVVNTLYTPAPPVVAPITADYGTRANLSIPSNPGNNPLIWYDRDMDVLDSNNTYQTDYLYLSDTFYVSASAMSATDIHIGNLASSTSKSSYPSPYNPANKSSKQQLIFSPSYLLNAGLRPGVVSAISFYNEEILTTSSEVTFATYEISVGMVEDTNFPNTSFVQDLDLVYSQENLTVSNDMGNWIKHPFTHNVTWDGVSSIVVQIYFELSGAKDTKGAKTKYSATSKNTVIYKTNASGSCRSNTTGSLSKNRMDVVFEGLEYGCESHATMLPVTVVNVPDIEATLVWPDGIDTVQYASCGATPLDVVVSNRGLNAIADYTIDYWVDGEHFVKAGESPIPSGVDLSVSLGQHDIMPGRHTLKAVVNAAGDNVHANDTVSRGFNVKFCTGTYTIGPNRDYETFAAALDTLTGAGVDGRVEFQIASGTYTGTMELGAAPGVSERNTITFVSETGNPEDVILKATPTSSKNYVLRIAGNEYVSLSGVTIYADIASNMASGYGNVVELEDCSHITLSNNIIRAAGGHTKVENSSLIHIKNNVRDIYITDNVLDSGYYAFYSDVTAAHGASNIYVAYNDINGFANTGFNLENVDTVSIIQNNIHSGADESNIPLTAIVIKDHTGALDIERNIINMVDSKNGGKRGIILENVVATPAIRSKIYNNMISCYGTAAKNATPNGINVKGVQYMNIYHNTVRIYAGATQSKSYAFYADEGTSMVNVMNNVFASFCKGYAYYVKQNTVQTSDYNAYYSTAAAQLAYWAGEAATLEALQTANNGDLHSIVEMPEFESYEDLHLLIGQYSSKGTATEVNVDIDGVTRHPIQPTIGAHEFFCQEHDVSIVTIEEPTWPASISNPNNIETDTVRVVVRLFNNGNSNETNLMWWAEILGTDLVSPTKNIALLEAHQMISDTLYVPTSLGLIDTQYIRVHLVMNGDMDTTNNVRQQAFYIAPAFDLQATQIRAITTGRSGMPDGCYLSATPIEITVKNVGKKPIPAMARFTVGFRASIRSGADYIPTLPTTPQTEVAYTNTAIPCNGTTTIRFSNLANLYPTGLRNDVSLYIQGWATYQYDLVNGNDTSARVSVDSYYTPASPEGEDAYIPFAAWGSVNATQEDNLIIRWFEDWIDTFNIDNYFYNGNGSYPASCTWNNTPQYFNDHTYYLATKTARNCRSAFSTVTVHVNPQVPRDVAVSEIVAPRNITRVYTEYDTVKVKITNYGTTALSNIPVVYEVRRNTVFTGDAIQRADEVCTATIAPGEDYIYKFHTLFQNPDVATQRSTFNIRSWTDLSSDQVRINDTNRLVAAHVDNIFTTIPESTYPKVASVDTNTLDIVNFRFNTLNGEFFPIGVDAHDFAKYSDHYNTTTGEINDYTGNSYDKGIPVLHVTRGTSDTLNIVSNFVQNVYSTDPVRLYGWIDYNRDGHFEWITAADSLHNERILDTVVKARANFKMPFSIPQDCEFGHMRMLIWADADTSHHCVQGLPSPLSGQAQQYLLFIDEAPVTVDAAFCRMIQPQDHFIDTSTHYVRFVIANKGTSSLANIPVAYSFISNDTVVSDTMFVEGPLAPGQSMTASLPRYTFGEGTTWVNIVLCQPNDQDSLNNVFSYDFHLFSNQVFTWEDFFDDVDEWYAPQGQSYYTRNYWERGVPTKPYFSASVPSAPNVWATSLDNDVVTGVFGNRSYLYTPKFNIRVIRPDTLSFYLAANLPNNAFFAVEYLDYAGQWKPLNYEEEQMGTTEWYPEGMNQFVNLQTSRQYTLMKFKTSMVSSDFPQYMQLRFVYGTKPGLSSAANFREGVALDNVKILRAQRAVDVGVVDIIEPTKPKFGEWVAPKIVIKNYGYSPITQFTITYKPWGSAIAKRGTWEGNLRPSDTVHYTFSDAKFLVSSNFPDTFSICATTVVASDLYEDNDTCCRQFILNPLNYDLSTVSVVAPTGQVVAGDSVSITVRLRNYGLQPVTQATLVYDFNHGRQVVSEMVNFDSIMGGLGIPSMEYCDYTFRQKVCANMGHMDITSYCLYPLDEYVLDDTCSGSFEGITNIVDVEASSILVDETDPNGVTVSLVVHNRGSRAANSFEIGYYIDDDTATIVRETYYTEPPLASLSEATHLFEHVLPHREGGYPDIKAFVHIENDHDPSNDTTSIRRAQIVDIKVHKVLVEENRQPDCFVRLEVENVGNLPLTGSYTITAEVNGERITEHLDRPIYPGMLYHLNFSQKVAKNRERDYQGFGFISAPSDTVKDNDTTRVVEVINYFEGIDSVELDDRSLELSQNYPNPFFDRTSVDIYLPQGGDVRFFILDIMGRPVYTEDLTFEAGFHTIEFAHPLPSSGIYYYGIAFDGRRLVRRMIYQK